MAEWNIYCETEKQIIPVWSTVDNPPIKCPNNPLHDITTSQNSYISRLARVRLCNGTIVTTNSPTYVPLMNYITQGSHISSYDNTLPIYIKIVSSVDSGSYDFSFVTIPDETILYESTQNTNTTPTIITIPVTDFNNLPFHETSVDIRFRTSGGIVTVRNISVYYSTSQS